MISFFLSFLCGTPPMFLISKPAHPKRQHKSLCFYSTVDNEKCLVSCHLVSAKPISTRAQLRFLHVSIITALNECVKKLYSFN